MMQKKKKRGLSLWECHQSPNKSRQLADIADVVNTALCLPLNNMMRFEAFSLSRHYQGNIAPWQPMRLSTNKPISTTKSIFDFAKDFTWWSEVVETQMNNRGRIWVFIGNDPVPCMRVQKDLVSQMCSVGFDNCQRWSCSILTAKTFS